MSERVITGKNTVCIVPCSGIGKSYGTVTREAAYVVAEELRPETTTIVPPSLLVLGDEEARAAVQDARVITVDGCKLACARRAARWQRTSPCWMFSGATRPSDPRASVS